MQGKRLLLAAISGLGAFAVTTLASAGTMSVPNGLYIEANAGSSHLSNKSYGGGSASRSGLGGNANLGYKFNPFAAVEVGYTQYSNTNVSLSNGSKAGVDKFYSYDVAAKGILPVYCTGLEAFAKLGMQHLNSRFTVKNTAAANSIGITSNNSHNTINAYYGAGVQYYFFPEFAIVAQWQRAQGNSSTGTLDLLSGGISFIVD